MVHVLSGPPCVLEGWQPLADAVPWSSLGPLRTLCGGQVRDGSVIEKGCWNFEVVKNAEGGEI